MLPGAIYNECGSIYNKYGCVEEEIGGGFQDQWVTKELETLLTEQEVLLDDHDIEPRSGRGRLPALSDGEVGPGGARRVRLLRVAFTVLLGPEAVPGVCRGRMPIMWCLAHLTRGEREVVAALVERNHHLIRSGQMLPADRGSTGEALAATTAAMGLRLLRPDHKDETYTNGNRGGMCQWIESVNPHPKGPPNGH